MKQTVRRTAAILASAAALALTSGCGYTYTQQTTVEYAASDGVNEDVGQLKLRNLLVVAEEEKSPGRLLGKVVNSGTSSVKLTLSSKEGPSVELEVPADSTLNLQDDSNKKILDPAGAQPGSLLEMKASGSGQDREFKVPLVDGTLEEYRKFLPTNNLPIPSKASYPEGHSGGSESEGGSGGGH